MKLQEVESLAISLIAKHLEGKNWQFVWDNRINALGCCFYNRKQIKLSKRWVQAIPDEEILDTILHEIAHAIAGSKAGHGYEWKQVCINIGAKAYRLADTDIKRSDIAIPTHRLIDVFGNTVSNYYRKPAKKTYDNVHNYYVKGRKEETLGKLKIVETSLLDLL